jgi:hypothetical protein
MTLRDYFAANVLQPILSDVATKNPELACGNLDKLAEAAYMIADAMLAERERGQQ